MHLIAENGGRLISRGRGRHPTRVIDSWELLFVVSGRLSMFFGKDECELDPGGGWLLAPGVRHGGTANYPPNLSFFWLHFRPGDRAAAQFLRRRQGRFTAAAAARLTDYCQLFLAVQADNPDQEALDLLLQLILHESGKPASAHVAEAPSLQRPPVVAAAEQILTLRFREPLSTAVIARELKCNPDYLGRVCRRAFAMPLTERLNQIRLRHASRMLAATSRYVSEIAYDTGFADLAYFRRRFRRQFGMSPADYRRVKAAGHVNTE